MSRSPDSGRGFSAPSVFRNLFPPRVVQTAILTLLIAIRSSTWMLSIALPAFGNSHYLLFLKIRLPRSGAECMLPASAVAANLQPNGRLYRSWTRIFLLRDALQVLKHILALPVYSNHTVLPACWNHAQVPSPSPNHSQFAPRHWNHAQILPLNHNHVLRPPRVASSRPNNGGGSRHLISRWPTSGWRRVCGVGRLGL